MYKMNLQMFAYDFGSKWKEFPPKEYTQCRYNIYSGWYSGDITEIERNWGQSSEAKSNNAFWSKKASDGLVRMHIPLASDMASISSDLIFADFPDISIPEAEGDNPEPRAVEAYNRLKEIIALGDIHSRLLEASESCSVLGGVYLKPVWDINLAPYPILSIAQADNAIPEFKWGILTAVTFWKVIDEDTKNNKVYRFFERHEKGKIYNAIYEGDRDTVGRPIPLSTYKEYANLEEEINTGYDGLLVRYVPNIKPNRLMRGSALGQSDLAGADTLFDAIDETYSSLMRDIRLAKAKLLVPETFLDFDMNDSGESKATFDNEQAVFTKLNVDPMMSKDTGISAHQFSIRTQEHINTILDLIERVVTHAGYSPQTFGLKIEGGESGTALNIRERRTFITRQKKWKYWSSALEDVFQMLLFIDNVHLKNATPYEYRPSLQINDTFSRDASALANTLNALNNAQALSIDTKVRMLHPEWEEDQILAEVNMIKEEYGLGSMVGPDMLDNIIIASKEDTFPMNQEEEIENIEE